VAGNGGSGIYIGTFSTGSTLNRNRLLGNDVDGITIIAAANATNVNGNTATGNRQDGIAILNTAAVLSKNVANANRGRGIRVSVAASDGGGNRARGNGPIEQCSPAITCPSPFKVKSGSTVPSCAMQVSTSITLAADMPLCSSGDGMEVIADGVTIDLNGHTLHGNRVLGQRGVIVLSGRTGVTIKNGIVKGFDTGFDLAGAGHTLDNVEARDSLSNGAVASTSAVTIKNSVFAQNSGHGLFLYQAPNAKVLSSFFAANFGDGLQTFAPNSTFSKLTIGGNAVSGVHLRGDAGATFKALVSAGNLFAGVLMEGNAGIAITKSTVAGNGPGILVESQTAPALVTSTTSIGNGGTGITIDAGVSTTITKNVTSGNAGGGISIGNIALTPLVAQNQVFGNGGIGIQNTSVATTLTKNIANGNHHVGILSVLGATDGGGNKARHNLGTDCSLPLVCS
jgi:parallel beta-helix repeat protein